MFTKQNRTCTYSKQKSYLFKRGKWPIIIIDAPTPQLNNPKYTPNRTPSFCSCWIRAWVSVHAVSNSTATKALTNYCKIHQAP